MKIVTGAKRADICWTARKLIELLDNGEVNFEIDIQRGYVWKDNDKKSAFIRSLILDRHVPPLYFNKVEDVYEGEDGKQRTLTLEKFLKDEFALSGLPAFDVINDAGEPEEIDINELTYSQLPECFQNAIKEYNFAICFTDDADQEEVADTFYNLNNGQSLNAATMNRVKAKSKDQIFRLGKHEIFKEALSLTALNGHTNEDIVGKIHAILFSEEPSMDNKWIRPYMRDTVITSAQEMDITNVLDRIQKVHGLIEDAKIAKRIYGRTHMVSIAPMVLRSITENKSDEEVMQWLIGFFSGSRSASISSVYNNAAGGSGTGKKEAVKKRLSELEKNYREYFREKKEELPKVS